jgi:hypothetical protein
MKKTGFSIEPLNAAQEVLSRGKTSAKTSTELKAKIAYAISRASKASHVRIIDLATKNVMLYPVVNKQVQMAGSKTLTKGGLKRGQTAKGKPGIINAIVSLLQSAVDDGGKTVDELVEELGKQFPERDADAMEITVRCQLGRLPKERGVNIVKQREGRVVRYAAAL